MQGRSNFMYQDLSQDSLGASASLAPEIYLPLWIASGNSTSVSSTGNQYLQIGQLQVSGSPIALHTLNSSWNKGNQYAFEASLAVGGTTTSYAQLWDVTANVAVSGSTVSTTSNTKGVIRSGKFSLTPSHSYGVAIWVSSTGGSGWTVVITDASLIAFPS